MARGPAAAVGGRIRERSARFLAGKDCRALAAVRRSNREQAITDAQLAAVRVPVLGIVGGDDGYVAQFRSLQVVMPHLAWVIVPGAGHDEAARRPEFRDAVLAFVASHDASAARDPR